MLDVYKITSVLEKLPDAQLQQYASMHKQDPYVLSLAVEESNRRKRIRSAPQGQEQGQGQPPPVNEQAVQGMAPEDTGIAQLPAGNMDFANGGIVAFAKGGAAPDEDPMDMATRSMFGGYSEAPDTPSFDWLRRLMGERGLYDFDNPEVSRPAAERVLARDQAEREAAAVREAQRRVATPSAPGATPAPAPTEKQTPRIDVNGATPPPRPDSGLSAALSARTAVATPRVGPRRDLLAELQAAEAKQSATPPGEAERLALRNEQKKLLDEAVTKREAAMPKGQAYERREAELKKEEEGVGSKKEENIKMALINAGLGMMAGTSQFAAVNIGEGAKQGVKSYAEGKEKLEKAAERRQELFDKIEEVRRAEQRGDAEKSFALSREAAGIEAKYRESQISALMSQFKVNRETAIELLKAGVQLDIAEMREGRADARTNAAIRSSESGYTKTAIQGEVKMLDTELTRVVAQLNAFNSNPVAAAQNPDELKALKQQYADLRKQRARLSAALRKMIPGLPAEDTAVGGGDKVDTTGFKVTPL